MPAASPATTFIPANLDATSWSAIEPYFQSLQNRSITSAAELEQWLIDRGELEAACSESRAMLYINMTCFTERADYQQAFEKYVSEVPPRLKPVSFALDQRYIQLAAQFPLPTDRYLVLDRSTRVDVELFRPENVPIETELDLLSQQFDQIAGKQTVEFDGKVQTLPQMARYQESQDRNLRETAWRAVAARRMQDVEAIHAVYDQMIAKRTQVAKNAGFNDYVGYAFRAMQRFDYTPAHCFAFHEAVERCIVPLVRELERSRASSLRLPALRPWDLAVDPMNRPPLKPFTGGHELMSRAVRCFQLLDPRLASMLSQLGDGSEQRGAAGGAGLDLDSRQGKAPGGYQYMLDRSRRPFIFMNAAGRSSDVHTMVHEAGHAFHSMVCTDEPLLRYRSAPIEFCEVASMSMELLTMPHWGGPGGYYPDANDHARAIRGQLEGIIKILPWIMTIDAFQHWVYSNPTHTRADRASHWLSLDARFGASVDWSGLDDIRKVVWQRQGHLFGNPFYYIEYGIAQLGALQLWLMSLERGESTAIDSYLRGLSLGGSKPLPELFAAAGIAFDFSPKTVEKIANRLSAELAKLPD
jgi:oligoendopeptidase F